jgi:hypothetical protein
MRTLVAGLLAAAAFVLNPAGCSGPTFHFGAQDVAKAVAGTWTVTRGGKSQTFFLEPVSVERHSARESLVPSAHACGTRSLMAEAGACTDTSRMVFDVLYADSKDLQGTARVEVYGTTFARAHVHVNLLNDIESFDTVISSTGEIVESKSDAVHVTHTVASR